MSSRCHVKTSLCTCGQTHQLNRRGFLRSLLVSAIVTGSWSSMTLPATALDHKAKALVLSCIDFRFLEEEHSFLLNQGLKNQYDWTGLAGASLALASSRHSADTNAFWNQLDISYHLHHIDKVIILDHQDCGAYAQNIDPNLSQNPEREEQVHISYLNQAYRSIHQRYPNLQIELYFVTPHQVKPIPVNS